MNINSYRVKQLIDKVEKLQVNNMTPEEIQKSFTKEEQDILQKAMHKYIRKEGNKYIYDENKLSSRKESNDGMDLEFEERMSKDPEYRKKIQEEHELKFKPEDLIAEEFNGEVIEDHKDGKYFVAGKWIDEDIVLKEKNPKYLERKYKK